jgi:hypothetical protein
MVNLRSGSQADSELKLPGKRQAACATGTPVVHAFLTLSTTSAAVRKASTAVGTPQ